MHSELMGKRRWISSDHFFRGLSHCMRKHAMSFWPPGSANAVALAWGEADA
jgi:hypothetical protein